LLVFLGEGARLALGLGLDGMELRCLLRLLDGLVEVGRTHLAGGGAADDVEGDDLHVVVLVSLLLRLHPLLVGLVAVVIDVEAGDERLVEARLRRVVLGAAAAHEQRCRYDGDNAEGKGWASLMHVFCLYPYYIINVQNVVFVCAPSKTRTLISALIPHCVQR